MKYPTMEEVEAASHFQLCRWHKFLPSPGWDAIYQKEVKDVREVMDREAKIMDRIEVRLNELSGITPQISKQIGLNRR